jgi:hypothetical protein
MKKVLLISLAFIIGLAVVAQKPQIKNGVFVRNYKIDQKVTIEPVEKTVASPFTSKRSGLKNGDNTNIVTVLDLGTSANVLGYSSGTRTMVWADDDLNCIINFHRAGPGATPPSLSGYYAMDLGVNMGASQGDWTSQIQVLAAQLVASPYYYDASRYPSAAIYNPDGNTTLANAYCTFFGPNFANLIVSGFGGYSYGRANLVNHADTLKHLKWYNPTPYTYIPAGYTISKTGIAHMVDVDENVESGSRVYQDSVIYGRGIWNTSTKDFDYTFKTMAFPCKDMATAADAKVACSPDGNTVWMSVLTNWAGATFGTTPLQDSTYYPLLRRSIDGGLTWGDPIPVYLDGPNGICGIKNNYSDYFIQNFFIAPFPNRDEIPYTCEFDHSLSVDKWGNPHIAVIVGFANSGYSVSYGVDSLFTLFDIYSVNDGATWNAVAMGSLKTFRGTWATYTADNRTYISRNKAGDKMFFTWNDTYIDGEINNQNPDVFARGFDLLTSKITTVNGLNTPNNVTFLCDITQEAYWQCTSPIVFTDNNKYTLPICTQWFADAAADSKFKYIPDFSYTNADFTLAVPDCNALFQVGIQKPESIATVSVYPNPVKDLAKVSLNLKQNASVTVEVTNLVGQQVMSFNKGSMSAGNQTFSIDASQLSSGVYFVSVIVNGQKFTQKMVKE